MQSLHFVECFQFVMTPGTAVIHSDQTGDTLKGCRAFLRPVEARPMEERLRQEDKFMTVHILKR